MIRDIEYTLYETSCHMEKIELDTYTMECFSNIHGKGIDDLISINENFKDTLIRILKAIKDKINEVMLYLKEEYDRKTIPPKIDYIKRNRSLAIDSSKNIKIYHMYAYDKGIDKIKEAKVPSFNYDALKQDLDDSRKFMRRYFDDYYAQEYTFIDSTRTVFRGSSDTRDNKPKNMNMNKIYEFCVKYRDILDSVFKDMKNIKKATDEAIRKAEKMTIVSEDYAYSVLESVIVQRVNKYGFVDESIDPISEAKNIEDAKKEIKRTRLYIDICFKFLGVKMSITRESFANLYPILVDNIKTHI